MRALDPAFPEDARSFLQSFRERHSLDEVLAGLAAIAGRAGSR